MKFFAFITAFLVLALSVMPCADTGLAANDGKAKTELTKSHEQKDDTYQDDCSPFCTCSCCAGFSINYFIALIFIAEPFHDLTKTAHFPSDTIEISFPFWQPPQLV